MSLLNCVYYYPIREKILENGRSMGKKVAIIQSNYIPWKGYFDIINMADVFILYDDVQYTRRDWRNRNTIKGPSGIQWLTIPIEVKGKYLQKIRDAKISDTNWSARHWKTIKHNYAKAKYFRHFEERLEKLYMNCSCVFLSDINYRFIESVNEILHIKTQLVWSHDLSCNDSLSKGDKLIELLKYVKATDYISGPSAKCYLNEESLRKENIKLHWMDYSGYPAYNQLFPPFCHNVSIIDLILNEGDNSPAFMKSFA